MEYLRKCMGKTVFGTMDGEVMKTLKTLMIFINQYKHIQILLGVKIKGSLESTSFFTKGDKVSVGNIVASI
jgi:hypothetical protein